MQADIKLTFKSGDKFFGPGVVSLLKEIDKCGNVREACEHCGFSYSKAWSILKKCEEESGFKLVDRQVGGHTGGTARVTDKAHDLLAIYDILVSELEETAGSRFSELREEYGLTENRGE